jgi:hypothetical protein
MDNLIAYSPSHYGCYIGDCYDVTANNIIVYESSEAGLKIADDAYNVSVSNFITRNNVVGPGITIADEARDICFSNCFVLNPGSDGIAIAGQDITFTNCKIIDCVRPLSFDSTTAHNITFIGCEWKNFSDYAIGYGHDVAFYNCRIKDTIGTVSHFISIQTTASNYKIIGNDFTNAVFSSRAINDGGVNTTIRENAGYPTNFYFRTGSSIVVGLSGNYGAATVLSCPANKIIVGAPFQLRGTGSIGVGETITIKVEAVYYSGNTIYVEHIFSDSAFKYNFTYDDWFEIGSTSTSYNENMRYLNIYAKSSHASTSCVPQVYFMQNE